MALTPEQLKQAQAAGVDAGAVETAMAGGKQNFDTAVGGLLMNRNKPAAAPVSPIPVNGQYPPTKTDLLVNTVAPAPASPSPTQNTSSLRAASGANSNAAAGLFGNLVNPDLYVPFASSAASSDYSGDVAAARKRAADANAGYYTPDEQKRIDAAAAAAKAAYQPLVDKAEAAKESGLPKDIVAAGENGGFMSTQYAGVAALLPTKGGDFIGAGGILSRISSDYDKNIASAQAQLNAAVEDAKQKAMEAIRTGDATDLKNAQDAYTAAEKSYTDGLDLQRKYQTDIAAAQDRVFNLQDKMVARADATIANLVKADVALTPDEVNDFAKTYNMTPEAFGKLYDVLRTETKQTKALDDTNAQIDQAKKLTEVLKDLPAGTPVQIEGKTYYGYSTSGITNQIEVDDSGFGRGITHDPLTGAWDVVDLGYIGSPKDGFTLQIDKNGNPWSFNSRTGAIYAATPSGTNAPGVISADWSKLIPDGTVWGAASGRANAGECGALVNDLTGLGVGDTFESKAAKIDKTIGTPKNPVQVGDVIVETAGNTGHVAIINSVLTGPDGKTFFRLTESNWHGDKKVTNTRQVAEDDPSIAGFARGTLDPRLRQGPDVSVVPSTPQFAGEGGTLKDVTVNGKTTTYMIGTDGVARPVKIASGDTLTATDGSKDIVFGNSILRKNADNTYSAVYTVPKDQADNIELQTIDGKPYLYNKTTHGLTEAPVTMPNGKVEYLQSGGSSDPNDPKVQDLAKRYAAATTETERKSITDQAQARGIDANVVASEASKIAAAPGRLVSAATGLPADADPTTATRITTYATITGDLLPRAMTILKDSHGKGSGFYDNFIVKNLPKEFRTAVVDQLSNITSSIQSQYFFLVSGAQVSPSEEQRLKNSVPSTDATVAQNIQRVRDFKTTMLDVVARDLRTRGFTITGEQVPVLDKDATAEARKKDPNAKPVMGLIPIAEFTSSKYEPVFQGLDY